MMKIAKTKTYINFIISIFIVLILCILKNKINKTKTSSKESNVNEGICIFIQDSCIHCHELKNFCNNIDMSKYDVKFYDIGNKKNFDLFLKYAKKHHMSLFDLGTPSIFSEKEYMVGFNILDHDDDKFLQFLNNNGFRKANESDGNNIKIPFFGSVNTANISSLKMIFMTSISEILSINNMFIFAFLFIICLLFETSKTKLLINVYFLFLVIIRFMFLTKFLNVAIFINFIKYISILIGWYIIYKSLLKLNFFNSDFQKDTIFEKLPNSIVFFVSILTFIAASIPFIRVNNTLGIYIKLVETKDIGNFLYFIYNLLLSTVLPLFDFLICFLLFSLLKNIKNFKNDLTIIKRFLLLILGIFIIFV